MNLNHEFRMPLAENANHTAERREFHALHINFDSIDSGILSCESRPNII
jgi:hypothetical protein